MAMSADEMARKRWETVSKREHQKVASAAANTRWERWRAANPEKAAASEARRAKRAKKRAAKRALQKVGAKGT